MLTASPTIKVCPDLPETVKNSQIMGKRMQAATGHGPCEEQPCSLRDSSASHPWMEVESKESSPQLAEHSGSLGKKSILGGREKLYRR